MKFEYTVEEKTPYSHCYTFTERNDIDERIIIEVVKCVTDNPADKKCMPYLWWKHGYINHVLLSYWSVHTYVYNDEGECWGKYNPQIKESNHINFEWMLEATEENLLYILKEVYQRANNPENWNREKERINKYVQAIKEYGIHEKPPIYTNVSQLPEIAFPERYPTTPLHSTVFSNRKSIRSKERKDYIVIDSWLVGKMKKYGVTL